MNSLFGDWKWKNPFATIQRPNPQDFITPGAVTTPGVSVNPHSGLGYFEFGDGTILPENIVTGMRTGDLLSTPQIMDKVDVLNDEFRWTKGADPKDQFEYFGDGNWGLKSDAPTYQQRAPSTFDADAYTGAMADYDYDSQIQAEKQKQLELLMQLGMGSPPPKASPLPPQSFGRSGNVKFSLLNPTSTVEQDAILSAPFLQKWRTMYGG